MKVYFKPNSGIWLISELLIETKYPEIKNKNPKVNGKKSFHPIDINWSKRNLGKLARTKINKNVVNITLKEKYIMSNTALIKEDE